MRDKGQMALDLICFWLPVKVSFVIHQFWNVVTFDLGIVMIINRIEEVSTMAGKYWEMWHFSWEIGQFSFKPNYMPKNTPLRLFQYPECWFVFPLLRLLVKILINKEVAHADWRERKIQL